MMDYLKKYNITDEQIKIIEAVLKKRHISSDIFVFSKERVEKTLDLFKNIGVNNFYEIIITNPSLFCDTVSSVEDRINSYGNKEEIARLINEDVRNLELVGLL